MKFRNQRHQELFTQAIRRLDRQNFTLMAVVYLFTADTRLWSMAKQSICYSGVDFSRVRLNNCSVRVYALYSAARDLYFGTDVLILSDLADAQVVPPQIFKVVCNAMAICRVGLDAIHFKERKDDE